MASLGWNIQEPTIDVQCPYTTLPDDNEEKFSAPAPAPASSPLLKRLHYTSSKARLLIFLSGLLAAGLLIAFTTNYHNIVDYGNQNTPSMLVSPFDEQNISSSSIPRGVTKGVSPKSFPLLGVNVSFPWSKKILNWERTAFHFQPKHNWMNDPNGPLFYKGWYHFFYQYNPEGPIWGNIVWGHAVSKDLIHWIHLPFAMVCDQWYDINGVWTGSATILPDGKIVMLYTGSTNKSVQVQNLAYPVDPSDPFLIEWSKHRGNPVLVPPPGIHFKDFRDPTTAWYTTQGKWRMIIGSKVNKTGITLVYDTVDFKNFDLLDSQFHGVAGTGMWECVDFYPVSTAADEIGLDTSDNRPGVKHLMKTSLDDDRNDYYALGTYNEKACTWTPDDPRIDVGIGLKYDYGRFYASKTFYDPSKKRRVLWGWITEMDSEVSDLKKGWASVQAIPRTVLFDNKTGKNLLQWPVEEVEQLRMNCKTFNKVVIDTGSVLPLQVSSATQLDIIAEFEINENAITEMVNGTFSTEYFCSMSGGAAQRGAFGPFGCLVLANNDRSEQTAIYFYITKGTNGSFMTFFCADHTRSSKADDVVKGVHGSFVSVLEGEKLSMRILVDHSIVESFAQGGRTCITSRIYPTMAIYEDAKLFLFNNATDANVTATVEVWEMKEASAAGLLHRGPSGLCIISFFLSLLLFFP